MFSKIAPVALLATATFAAPSPAAALEERSLYCLAQNIILGVLQKDASATAFCSSYLKVAPVTATVTSTGLATVTALATTTVTLTATGAKSTSTCAPVYANANAKRAVTSSSSSTKASSSSACPTPTAFIGLAAAVISADCACLSIPTSTTTLTIAKTSAVTVTQTTVATAHATVTPTAIASQLYDLNGTYTSSNSAASKFQLYPNLDFPSNDAFQGTCGVAGDVLTTSDGTFACTSWNDCMDICAAASWGCVGVSFVPSWNYCYLKNAVPGNGLTSCGTVQAEIVESALNIAQGNVYAVSN